MRSLMMPIVLLVACATQRVEVEGVTIEIAEGRFDLVDVAGRRLSGVSIAAGTGSSDVQFNLGTFLFTDEETVVEVADSLTLRVENSAALLDAVAQDGSTMGTMEIRPEADGVVRLSWTPAPERMPAAEADGRLELGADCDEQDHFLGLGAHAMDVDHVGQRFPLWVSEPGIGKSQTEEPTDDWFVTGTRHASSYPVPFLLRPHHPQGLLADTTARVFVDLCATDATRFSLQVHEAAPSIVWFTADEPLGVVERLSDVTGRPDLPPAWVFGPWIDSIRGVERLWEVVDAIRDIGAPTSVLWTEDWKGADENATGYRLSKEWFVDSELYPDASNIAVELEGRGFAWLGYFAPFIGRDTVSGDQAQADGVLIRDAQGEPYWFKGVTFEDTSLVDLSTAAGREWADERMEAAVDLGFRGWMVDFAEWLPTDAVLADGADARLAHNDYPRQWQQTNADVLGVHDGVWFCRSGWGNTAGTCPVVWGGDQRTSFDGDDGFPTVIPLGLGLAASGVPIFTHDVAGYNSVGNPPSTRELWFRWASLGAFSPVLRTHHGAFDTDNWQFDTDPETLAHWAAMATEHMRLWPYRYGLAAQAAERGTPMVMAVGFLYPEVGWDGMDSWMLGPGLLVAPVLGEGDISRHVSLPSSVDWYDWWTLEPVASGVFDAAVEDIPVFAPSGVTIPMFEVIPDTVFVADLDEDVVGLDAVDGERVVRIFGDGGEFTEADGTRYTVIGQAIPGGGEAVATFDNGSVEVAGLTVDIVGPRERVYRVVVVQR